MRCYVMYLEISSSLMYFLMNLILNFLPIIGFQKILF